MAIYVRDEKGVLQAWEIAGYKGERGEAGVTPNLQIGDVITLESGQQASITRRGDDENPIFDFAIPKGDNGEDGIFVGRVEDAPSHAQVVVNDDASPYDLFFEDANVSYMGDTYTSLKEKSDADIEYLLRKFGTQHYEGSNITATDTYQKQVKSAILKGKTGYRDKDTGEILEAFEEGRNLELVSVKSPVLTTYNDKVSIFNQREVFKGDTKGLAGMTAFDLVKTYKNVNISFKKNFGSLLVRLYKDNDLVLNIDESTKVVNREFNRIAFRKADEGYWVANGEGKESVYKWFENGLVELNMYSTNEKLYPTLHPQHKSNILSTPPDLILRGIGNTQDTLDLINGEYIKRIETRPYQQGDESNAEVLTDKVNTIYKLAQPITSKIDLKGQKVYSYDATTHYITSSGVKGHPAPILSIDVPTNTTKMIARQRAEIEQQEQKLQEQEEVQNLLIESQLAWFEDNISTLELTDEDAPSHIQKLYELTRKCKVEEE